MTAQQRPWTDRDVALAKARFYGKVADHARDSRPVTDGTARELIDELRELRGELATLRALLELQVAA